MERVKVKGVILGLIKGEKSIILKSLLITCSILLVLYIGISIFFISHFHFNSIVNGINISGMSTKKANEIISRDIGELSIELKERNGIEEKIYGKDINLRYVLDGKIQKLKKIKVLLNGFPLYLQLKIPI